MLGCQLLALLIHSYLEAVSAASVINLIDVLLSLRANTNWVKALQSDWPTNPLQPISVRSQWAHHPFILHCSTSSWNFVSIFSRDSAMFSSHDTVNSHMITYFVVFKTRIMSGRSCVRPIWLENFSSSSKSTNNSQSGAMLSSDVFFWRCWSNIPSCLNKIDSPTDRLVCAGSKVFVKYPRNFPQHLIMTPAVISIAQCPCAATEYVFKRSSLFTQQEWYLDEPQMSEQLTFLFKILSHQVQAPYWQLFCQILILLHQLSAHSGGGDMVLVIGNGLSNISSNPGWGCLHFIQH